MKGLFLSYIISILLCNISNAQLPDSLIRKVDSIFSDYDRTNSPGCSLAILKDGKIIYKRGYGMSNLEYNIAISPSSIFHVASVSKQFAAASIIHLSLEGKLSLDDDIRKYVPEVPDFGHVITINHLLHHTSGLRDQWDLQSLAGWRDGDLITEGDVLEMLSRQKALNFLPGEEFNYCNTGYTLLGVAVKKITGVSLRDYADSVFFKPLGMTNTHFHSDHSEVTPNRTSAYQKDDKGQWKISIPVFDTYGATSLFTTVDDLAKWDENFYTRKIGGDGLINAMQTIGVLNDKTLQTYASGLVIQSYKGNKTVEHGGADAGYRCYFLRFPDDHFTVIVLSNMANINVRSLSFGVVDLFLKDKTSKTAPTNFSADKTVLQSLAGEYLASISKETIEIVYKDGQLMNGSTVLVPSSNTVFTDPNSMATATFSTDGRHTKFILKSIGQKAKSFEKVRKLITVPTQLQEFKGEYYSTELDVRYRITIKDSVLLVKTPRNDDIPFSGYIQDSFFGYGTSLNISFDRDKKNKVTGFYFTTGRSRNLYFKKVNAIE